MKKHGIILGLFILAVVVLAGCTSQGGGQTATSIPPTNQETIYAIGDNPSDGKLVIRINGIRFVKEIDEQNNSVRTITALENKKYLIISLTVENLQTDKKEAVGIGRLNSQIYSSEGYVSDAELGIQANFLANSFPLEEDTYVFPNSKVRGDIPYEIFDNATGLKAVFTYQYDPVYDPLKKWSVTFNLENTI